MEPNLTQVMHIEWSRLRSFKDVTFLTPEEKVNLASQLFYVRNGEYDNLECYKCGVTFENGLHEIPKIHRCKAIPNLNENVIISSPYYGSPGNYADGVFGLQYDELRLATFASWSYSTNKELEWKVSELAKAGFYYARKPFGVECIWCQLRITVLACELTNILDIQVPKPTKQNDCRHVGPLKLLIDGDNRRPAEKPLKRPKLCRLCNKYHWHIAYQPYYNVYSCDQCGCNLKKLLSPSLLPSYKVDFHKHAKPGRRLNCQLNI